MRMNSAQDSLSNRSWNVKSKRNSAAIIVGASGQGPWQDYETRAVLAGFVEPGGPIIPLLLSTCSIIPELPLFLKQVAWVDFRSSSPDPMDRLLRGIRGRKN